MPNFYTAENTNLGTIIKAQFVLTNVFGKGLAIEFCNWQGLYLRSIYQKNWYPVAVQIIPLKFHSWKFNNQSFTFTEIPASHQCVAIKVIDIGIGFTKSAQRGESACEILSNMTWHSIEVSGWNDWPTAHVYMSDKLIGQKIQNLYPLAKKTNNFF